MASERLTDEEEDILLRVDGLFVGQLRERELVLFLALVAQGAAFISYEGAAGFLGLGTCRAARLILHAGAAG